MVVRADVLIMPILHPEPTRYSSKLDKSESLIQMPCVNITFHHGIELQHSKAMFLRLFQAVHYKFFSDVLSPHDRRNRITRIADMTASAHIVWMKYVQTYDFSRIGFRNAAITLAVKELFSRYIVQRVFLRKGYAIFYDLVPDRIHERYVSIFKFPNCNHDSFTSFPLICSIVSSRHCTLGRAFFSSFWMYSSSSVNFLHRLSQIILVFS